MGAIYFIFIFRVFFKHKRRASDAGSRSKGQGLTAKPQTASRVPVDSGRFHEPPEALAVAD